MGLMPTNADIARFREKNLSLARFVPAREALSKCLADNDLSMLSCGQWLPSDDELHPGWRLKLKVSPLDVAVSLPVDMDFVATFDPASQADSLVVRAQAFTMQPYQASPAVDPATVYTPGAITFPAGVTSVLVDISETIARAGLHYPGDSFDRYDLYWEWAQEFEADFLAKVALVVAHSGGDLPALTYIEDVENYALAKAKEAGFEPYRDTHVPAGPTGG